MAQKGLHPDIFFQARARAAAFTRLQDMSLARAMEVDVIAAPLQEALELPSKALIAPPQKTTSPSTTRIIDLGDFETDAQKKARRRQVAATGIQAAARGLLARIELRKKLLARRRREKGRIVLACGLGYLCAGRGGGSPSKRGDADRSKGNAPGLGGVFNLNWLECFSERKPRKPSKPLLRPMTFPGTARPPSFPKRDV